MNYRDTLLRKARSCKTEQDWKVYKKTEKQSKQLLLLLLLYLTSVVICSNARVAC